MPQNVHACSVAQLCLTLCNFMDCSPPGSSVHGILQARILERLAISSSRGSFQPRDQTLISCIASGFFTIFSSVTQSCPTLCDPMDCSPPGSFVRGILQARILEWVAVSFSRQSLSGPGLQLFTWLVHSSSQLTDERVAPRR